MNKLITVPMAFFVDHQERGLPTPVVQHSGARSVTIWSDDAALSELLDDARHYAHDNGPNGGAGLKKSAAATVRAIELGSM